MAEKQEMKDVVMAAIKKADRAAFSEELHQWFGGESKATSFDAAINKLAMDGRIKWGRAFPVKQPGQQVP